jgi:hypothetical protein
MASFTSMLHLMAFGIVNQIRLVYSEDWTHRGNGYNLKQLIHEITIILCPDLTGVSLEIFRVKEHLS